MKFHVPDMSCSHCVAAIEKAVIEVDKDAKVESDIDEKIVNITSSQDFAALQNALEDAGYPATQA